MELWKVCIENENYEVSNLGNIRSLKNTYIHKSANGKDVIAKKKIRNLSGSKLSTKGYKRINLNNKIYFTHTIVANNWVKNPENKKQVNHKNGIKTDNRAVNLEWVTNQENRDHAVKNGLHYTKFTLEEMKEIQLLYKTGNYTYDEIALIYDCNRETIGKIVLNKLKILKYN